MGKMQALLLATSTQQGVVRVGSGLRVPVPGFVDAVRPIADLWVDATGDDTNGDGSMGNPFATLSRTFAFISAIPLVDGYTVHLPSGDWFEDVGLPPPGTRLVGKGAEHTVLAGAGGVTLAWVEGLTDPGVRTIEGVWLVADVTGRDGGNISLVLLQSHIQGTLMLLGRLVMDGCDGDYTSLINCSNVTIYNPATSPSSGLILTFDPVAGTNGPGSVYNAVMGGLWSGIQYDSMDATVPLYVLGAKVLGSLVASSYGRIEATSGTVAADLTSSHAVSEIAYDGPVDDASPTFHGLGKFRNAELVLKRTVPMNFGSGDVTVPIPPQVTTSLKNTFVMVDLPGISVSWVSSTSSTITLHVTAPVAHPSYELRILVKP